MRDIETRPIKGTRPRSDDPSKDNALKNKLLKSEKDRAENTMIVDLLRACFPGGSITGAPKIRAMEIINEIENLYRGAYCGCIGYIGFNGTMDTNILIRTLTYNKDTITLQAGGGIVADSDPKQKYQETLDKASAILNSF